MRGTDRLKGKPYSQNRADARWEGEGGSQEAEQETPGEDEPEGEDRTDS